MNLTKILNESKYAFYFLVVDEFLDIDVTKIKNFFPIYAFKSKKQNNFKETNKDYFCLEEEGTALSIKNSGQLLNQEKTINFIKKTSSLLKLTPVIIPFKPSAKISLICQKNNWICASNPAKLNRILEDKINFYKICQKNNIPCLPTFIDTFTQENFEKYQQMFDSKLVIQTRFGWAGKSTYIGSSWDDLKEKIVAKTTVKFSPFLSGYSLTNNCCLTKSGPIQSPPALQFTGIPSLTQNPFTTVGRQWPSYSPIEINEKIKKITKDFSEILKKTNYLGFFGLDFFITENQVFLLECNPRLTASSDLYYQIEDKNNINPLFLFHIAQFLPINFLIDLEQENKRFYNNAIVGSEINQKDLNNNTINRYRDFIPFSLQNNPIDIPQSIINKVNEENKVTPNTSSF